MPATMTREQVAEKVLRLAAEQVGMSVAEVHLDSHLVHDLSFDSLNKVEFVMELEDEFDVSVSDADAEHVDTVRQAVDLLFQVLDEPQTAEP